MEWSYFGHGVLPASAPDLGRGVAPLGHAIVRLSQLPPCPKGHGQEDLPHVRGQGQQPRVPGCNGAGTAERSYPTSEVRGAAERRYPASKVRGSDERSYPASEVRGGS